MAGRRCYCYCPSKTLSPIKTNVPNIFKKQEEKPAALDKSARCWCTLIGPSSGPTLLHPPSSLAYLPRVDPVTPPPTPPIRGVQVSPHLFVGS